MRSSFCLESVTSPSQILRNPLNNSVSKQLYSFSKDSRFKRYSPYCDNIYNLPSHFKRSQSSFMGSKKKISFKNISMFDAAEVLNHHNQRFDNRVLNVGPTFTMRKKLKVIDKKMSIQAQNDNPEGGRYENQQALSPKGNYFLSKHKSTGFTKFNPRSSQKYFEFKNLNPGPGRYDEINQFSDSGKYSLSKTHGDGKRFFDKERRVVKFQYQAKQNYNPGPGSYRSPSDFGNYDGNVYNSTGGISYIQPLSRKSSRSRF